MAEGLGVFLAITGLAVLLVFLSRCSAPRADLTQAWQRHEARDVRSQTFARFLASAIYDPDWQWYWQACDRQLESIRVIAMEKLRAEIETGSGDPRGAMVPTNNLAQLSVPSLNDGDREGSAPAGD